MMRATYACDSWGSSAEPSGTTGQLATAMRHQVDRIQRRPRLITGFLGRTGLSLDSQPP